MAKYRTGTAVASVLLMLGGCAFGGGAPPSVQVAGVELRGAGLFDQAPGVSPGVLLGVALGVSLCVTNPNDTALRFRRVRAGVDIAGAPLADGVSETAVDVPPHASVLVPFAVATTTANLGPQILGVLRTGGIEYRLHGSVQLGGALAITVPFSRSGRLDPLVAGQALLSDPGSPAGTPCGAATAGAG